MASRLAGIVLLSSDQTRKQADPFALARFTTAQEGVYDRALAEIRRGSKQPEAPRLSGMPRND